MSIVDDLLADLRDELAEVGEVVIIRRYADADLVAKTEAKVQARVTGLGSQPLVEGELGQARFKIVAINDPLAEVETGFVALSAMLPIQRRDVIVYSGRELELTAIDAATRRVGGVQIGLDLEAVG